MSQHRARAGSSPDDTYGFGEDGEIVPAVDLPGPSLPPLLEPCPIGTPDREGRTGCG